MPVRPVGPDQLSRVLPLIRPDFEELELDEAYLAANLFDDPEFEPDLCLGSFEGAELVAMVAAVPRRGSDPKTGSVGHLKILYAREGSPPLRALAGLLERAETTLRGLGAERAQTDGAAPVYLVPGLPRRRQATRALLEEAGYRVVEERRSMTVDLDRADLESADPRGPSPSEIVFRRGQEYDRAVIPAQVRSTFSDEFAFEVDLALDPSSRGKVHLAVRGEHLVGFSVAGLWAANAFGPIGTVPEFEGRGIGAILLKRALRDLRSAGISVGLIPWVGPEGFYRRAVNAKTTLEYDLLEKPLRTP